MVNPPKMEFINDVDEFMNGKDVTEVLTHFDETHQKYRFFELNLLQKKSRLKRQLPDFEKSLEVIKLLEKNQELSTYFLMSNQVYSKARIPATNKVCLWLGANVMLEYTLDEAKALLTKNLQTSQTNLEHVEKDLEFLRDQITTSEVNLARVFNWNVKKKQGEKANIGEPKHKLYMMCFGNSADSITSGHITYIEVKEPLKGTPPGPVSVWPLPQIWTKSSRVLVIDTVPFNFVSNVHNCSIIDNAINRYRTIVKAVGSRPASTMYNSSSVEMQAIKANIQSLPTIKGALRGLETFSQLVWNYHGNLVINETSIKDWPRFEYRGMMIDTARHFIPKPVLMANLDAMAYNKFNVFHWHIVDDQSWPMESTVFPDLHKMGAYSPHKIYTIADMLEIIEYARMRGIRVIPEIDTPGHTQTMGKAIKGILTPCYGEGPDKPNTPNYPHFAAQEMLNPTIELTYQVVSQIIQEVKQLFPDPFIHLGMDESYYDCWESNPHVREWMLRHNMTRTRELESFYVTKTIDNVQKLGYKTIIWQDPLDNGAQVPVDAVVEVWKDYPTKPWRDTMRQLAEFGNPLILSACWYLNYISYGQDWEKYYVCDPHSFTNDQSKRDKVFGGEAAIWTEYVDGAKLLPLAWPRASAVAERLWSAPNLTRDVNDARFRLDEQRCKMLERGIPTNPVTNGYCPFEWYEETSPITDGRLRTWPN
ncbi:Beta-hexosaminidase subunit beta [Fragariocoptes setiger]|uniref:beta-N-acetylhexosaminidase n=1 Tax=Fragariocoptes setiger TaxID=1670756 RepID=A0ABQ7SCD3_9ACAR|nr:Beta-hexosaminidase subunit beta [Fragariocoptes setiger]